MPTSLNYPGSSGYGVLPDLSYGTLTTTPVMPKPPADYPVFDITTGKLISLHTKQPWTGPMPYGWSDPGGSATPAGGVQVPYAPVGTMINPNDPMARYKPVTIPKSPDIATGEADLMKTFKDAASSSLQDFSKYLKSFTSDLGAARTAGAAATDIAPTVNALQTGQAAYAGGLTADQKALQDLLASNATAERGIVAQDFATLPKYDAAAKAVADQQMALVGQNLNRYKMGTGTPSSIGSDEERILAGEAAKVYAPMELAKIQAEQGMITGLSLPVQQDITNRATSALTQFNPQVQAAIWSSGRATAQDVQNLKVAVAGMSYQQALQFMTALGVPVQVQQSILSGQIGQLGQLGQIESGANYQGLQDILGVYQAQPLGFNMGIPPIPNYPPRYASPNMNTIPNLAPASTAPIDIGGGAVPATPAFNSPTYQNQLDRYLASLPIYQPATGGNPASFAGGAAEGRLVAG